MSRKVFLGALVALPFAVAGWVFGQTHAKQASDKPDQMQYVEPVDGSDPLRLAKKSKQFVCFPGPKVLPALFHSHRPASVFDARR